MVWALKELLREPGQQKARVIGLSAAHDGRPGDVQLHGMVASPQGYSANARIVDAGVFKSNRLVSPALAVGANASPTVALFNRTGGEMNVSLIAHYSIGDTALESPLDQVRLAAREARAVDLRSKVESLPLDAREIGLELQSFPVGGDAGAGGLIADLLLAGSSGPQVFQVSPKDPAGEGSPGFSHPWQLDGDSNTILTIANPSQTDFAAYNVFLHFPGGNYTFDDSAHGYRLEPGEVRHIDLKRLRDEQVLSDLGVPLPAGVVSGQAKVSIQGEMGKPNRLIAEAIIFDPVRKTASTTACQTCPANATHMSLSPTSATGNVGANVAITPRCHFTDGTSSIIGNPFALTWFPGNSSVISVSAAWNSFKVNFLAPGSTTLNSNSTDCHWEFDFQTSSCGDCSTLDTLSLIQLMNLTVNPVKLSGAVTNIPVSDDGQAIVAAQSFSLRVEAVNPNTGLRNTSYSGQASVAFSNSMSGETISPNPVSLTSGVGTTTITLKGIGPTGQAPSRSYTLNSTAGPASQGTGSVNVWFEVTATLEGLVGQPTSCGNIVQPNDHFVALPSTGMCNIAVKVKRPFQLPIEATTVKDVGPWFPHSSVSPGNPCVGGNDKYWNEDARPRVLDVTCDSNNAAIDLADGTAAAIGISGLGTVRWRFN